MHRPTFWTTLDRNNHRSAQHPVRKLKLCHPIDQPWCVALLDFDQKLKFSLIIYTHTCINFTSHFAAQYSWLSVRWSSQQSSVRVDLAHIVHILPILELTIICFAPKGCWFWTFLIIYHAIYVKNDNHFGFKLLNHFSEHTCYFLYIITFRDT